MKIKDIITVTLLTVCNIVIYMAVSVISFTPITLVLLPVFHALLQGIIFFVIGAKVKKRGAIFLYCLLHGIMGGYLPYFLLYLAAGVIAELILAKKNYGSLSGLTVSYVIIQVFACVSGTIYPFVFALQNTIERQQSFNRDYSAQNVSSLLGLWGSLILVALVIIASFIGSFVGQKILKKHILNDESDDVQVTECLEVE